VPRDETSTAASETFGPSRSLLLPASVLFAAWVVALATLVVTTANPPLLNWAQLGAAKVLVTAHVDDVAAGRCRLLKAFTPGMPPEKFTVTSLVETGAQTGGEYLLPLQKDIGGAAGSYRVVTVPQRGLGPLIYPLTPDLEERVVAWQQARP
jgi:hypothetical protein